MKCTSEFRAVHDSGPRFASAIKWIVIHDEEASTARSAALWFTNPASGGSANRCVDDKECYRTVPDLYIPWGASNANTNGLHLEMAGFAAWKKWQWLKHRRELNNAAEICAHWCKKYDIPRRWLTPEDMRAGRKGFVTHATVSAYTLKYGLEGDHSHTDPGVFFPKRRFMRKVRAAYRAS